MYVCSVLLSRPRTIAALPIGAKPLAVALTASGPTLWASCPDNQPNLEQREFITVINSNPIPGNAIYIGSYIEYYRANHVFETTKGLLPVESSPQAHASEV